MNRYNYVKVDRIFSMLTNERRTIQISDLDIVDWIDLALSFMAVPEIQEEKVAFIKIENYQGAIPKKFQIALEVFKYNNSVTECNKEVPKEPTKEETVDCLISCLSRDNPQFSIDWKCQPWMNSNYCTRNFGRLTLANNSLFGSLVCKRDEIQYDYCGGKYTIEGVYEKKLVTSFKDGVAALAYYSTAVDPETGYPMIPDAPEYITAILYFIKWKISEISFWESRQGSSTQVEYYERKWLKYIKQAKNSRIYQTVDELYNGANIYRGN